MELGQDEKKTTCIRYINKNELLKTLDTHKIYRTTKIMSKEVTLNGVKWN